MPKENKPGTSKQDAFHDDFQISPGTGIYDLDYYSGSQCAVYIGDVFVDEVTSIQFQVQQNKRPVYGYASQLFDAVAPGTVIVQGSFTINFKESGYLWMILQRYKELNELVQDVIPNADLAAFSAASEVLSKNPNLANSWNDVKASGKVPLTRFFVSDFNETGRTMSHASIERLITGEATRAERYEFYNALAGYATVNNPQRKDKTFEDIVEEFENKVWDDNGVLGKVNLDTQIRRADDNAFDNFDLFVVYGDVGNIQTNHTVRRIKNIHLLSTGQVIMQGGEPIQEEYSFIARNIV